METNLVISTSISNHSNQIDKREDILEETYWDCSVCTYKNTPGAFKCRMCDVRKGTSTRKPRLNQQILAQQAAQNFPSTMVNGKKLNGKKMARKIRPRLKNIDRNSAQEMSVTVGNITVTITDYKLLPDDRLTKITDTLSNSIDNESLDKSLSPLDQTTEVSHRNNTISID